MGNVAACKSGGESAGSKSGCESDPVMARVSHPRNVSMDAADEKSLRSELQQLKLAALRKRAIVAGVDEEDVNDALDADDPKAALISLLVKLHAEEGPAADLLSAISAGGEAGVGALAPVLEHALEVLEALSASTPRRSRKGLRELLERVESVCDSVDLSFCDGIAQGGTRCELERLGCLLVGGSDMKEGMLLEDAVSVVSELLDCLEECGSVVVQAVSGLRNAVLGLGGEHGALGALEMLRSLSVESQGSVCSKEMIAAELVIQCLVPESGAEVGCALRESGCMALFALGCRNGVVLCGTIGFLDITLSKMLGTSMQALFESVSRSMSAESDTLTEVAAVAAAMMVGNNLVFEAVYKLPAAVRGPLEKRGLAALKAQFVRIQDSFTEVHVHRVWSLMMEHRLFEGADLLLVCGLPGVLQYVWYMHMVLLPAAIEAGVFSAIWGLHMRIFPEPMGAEWWLATNAVVDVRSVYTFSVIMPLSNVKKMPSTVIEKHVLLSSWWGALLAESVRMMKINASAGLSAQETMPVWTFSRYGQIVETAAAAAHESQHLLLLESGVVEALEYAATHDFVNAGVPFAAGPAGALISLLGRNEGGKTLSQSTVFAVLSDLGNSFTSEHFTSMRPLTAFLVSVSRVVTMAVSDTNKRLMLQFDGVLDLLVKALLLDSPRRSEKGAVALQEAAAEVFASLALFGPGADVLRVHSVAMSALRALRDGGLGTDASRQRAMQALFQLEDRSEAQTPSDVAVKHVMMSYNWDHQPVIKRIHAALVARGYSIWIDVEQMKGSTVDAMSKAVEDAAVVLIGVSRAYKESTNCRMEAQYAMQREIDTVPLMLVDGYQADGWLGMLMGTRLWYGFYGCTLTDSGLFGGKIEELCRELGDRGRAGCLQHATAANEKKGSRDPMLEGSSDSRMPNTACQIVEKAEVAVVRVQEPHLETNEPAEVSALRSKLEGMRLMAVQKRAVSEGVPADAVEDAMDGDDPKSSLVRLIIELASSRGPVERLLLALSAGGETAADMLAAVMEHAMDVLERVSMSTGRKSRKSVRDLLESVEELSECVDAEWCDGLARCDSDRLEGLASCVLAVQVLASDQAAGLDCVSIVSSMVESLRECGSVVVQCASLLRMDSGSDDELANAKRLGALDCLRCLPEERLGCACDEEVCAAGVVVAFMGSGVGGTDDHEQREVACMVGFVLGVRNGGPVCGFDGVLYTATISLLPEAYESCMDSLSGLRVACALHACFGLLMAKVTCSVSASIAKTRAEKFFNVDLMPAMASIKKVFVSGSDCIYSLMSDAAKLFEDKSVSFAFSGLFLTHLPPMMCDVDYDRINREGFFSAGVAILRRCPASALSVEWWSRSAQEVDVTAVRLTGVATFLGAIKRLSLPWKEPWWRYVLGECIEIVRMHAVARLADSDTVGCSMPVLISLQIIFVAGSVESERIRLLDTDILESVEYALKSPFGYVQLSMRASAASAAVAICGRNEGGKTLSAESVDAVLTGISGFFASEAGQQLGVAAMLSYLTPVRAMVVSDANKRHMLRFEGLIDLLVDCLLLVSDESPRHGQVQADVFQETSASVLQELALFGPGADALRAHPSAMDALRSLAECGLTDECRQCAVSALFELDEGQRSARDQRAGAERLESSALLHVMISYNWGHQETIMRMVKALQAHGYVIWVDVEQMKGSTVDTMAAAVEGAEVMLIGVSRAYKESSNCRMEAQYGMQRQKDMIPLMMEEGYQPDGWLGMMMGTRLWYGLYGEALSSDGFFEERMAGVMRELSDRGRGRGRGQNVSDVAVAVTTPADDAEDAARRSEEGDASSTVAVIGSGGKASAEIFASVLEHGVEVLDRVVAGTPRKARKALRELLERVEFVIESVDVSWCDGLAQCDAATVADLVALLVGVRNLAVEECGAEGAVSAVFGLLECMEWCGSVVLQSLRYCDQMTE